MPILSVVTINRNNDRGLQRTIDSFRCYRNDRRFEFLLVDGASSDDSLAVARGFYREPEVISEPDHGIYDAMNKGWQRASAEFVIWINSGDALAADLAPLWGRLGDESADVYAFAVEERAQGDRPVSVSKSSMELIPAGMLQHQGLVFSRSLVASHGGYDTSYRIAADRDLLLRLYFHGARISCCPDVIAIFDGGGVSKMRQELAIENNRISYRHGLIGLPRYLYRRLRIENEPLWGRLKRRFLGGE